MSYRFSGSDIEITHPNRVLYPDERYTKKDIAKYYYRIWEYIKPRVLNRPVVMFRFPKGITSDGFYHKRTPDYFPDHIERQQVPLKKGEIQEVPVIDELDDLLYMVNHGTLVFHTWMSCKNEINHPDKIVIDLDPSDDNFNKIKEAAFIVAEGFEELGLQPLFHTSGSRGIHVWARIKPVHDFKEVKQFLRQWISQLVEEHSKLLTDQIRKNKRKERVFVDYLRNEFGQTAITPYSLRARPGAPVATPIRIDEISSLKSAQQYTVNNIFRRLGAVGDIWNNISEGDLPL